MHSVRKIMKFCQRLGLTWWLGLLLFRRLKQSLTKFSFDINKSCSWYVSTDACQLYPYLENQSMLTRLHMHWYAYRCVYTATEKKPAPFRTESSCVSNIWGPISKFILCVKLTTKKVTASLLMVSLQHWYRSYGMLSSLLLMSGSTHHSY